MVCAAKPVPTSVTVAPSTGALLASITLPPIRKEICRVGSEMASASGAVRSPSLTSSVITIGAVTGAKTSMPMVTVTVSDGRNLLPMAVQNSAGSFSPSVCAINSGSGGSCPTSWPRKNGAGIFR